MKRAALAGLAYFAIVFAFGFGLGSVRVLLVAPALGEFKAVLIELPVMLMACWLIAGWLTRRLRVPNSQAAALLMSGVAFTCLMLAELSFGALAFDRTISDQLQHWLTPAGALGLIGQIVFALFAWIQVRRPASN
jgi:membrane-anchored protein YejM (alkaline phosphatase superfamily)